MSIVLPDCKGSEGSEVLDSRNCGIALGASLMGVAVATGMINKNADVQNRCEKAHLPLGFCPCFQVQIMLL
jgi:hypothetical protein